MSTLVGRWRAKRLARDLRALESQYGQDPGLEALDAFQLERFNEIWQATRGCSPYYGELARRHRLPERFDDWQTVSRMLPVMERGTLARDVERIRLRGRRAEYRRITGGSTAEPIQLPAWRSEDRVGALDTWCARGWFGVTAADRLFLLWGHSHLLGSGLGGWWNASKRRLKDRSLGYLRVSAYDLGEPALREACEKLLEFQPDYVLGYSVALHRLALANRHRARELDALGIKVVVATGESFPSPDSAAMISDIFGCPVAMEYGAVETGIIAHQRPDGRFHVFWGSHYVESVPSRVWPDREEILVTALYPRLVPLIRYRVGDLLPSDGAAAAFSSGVRVSLTGVIGRCNDAVRVGAEDFVHSETFSHALRDSPDIHAYQVVQGASGEIVVNYLSAQPLSEDGISRIRRRLRIIDERLRSARLVHVSRLEETVAGKTKAVVNHLPRGDAA